MKRPIQIVLLLVAVLVLSGPGLAAKSGKSRTVTQAAKGSPEALIASALVAAQDKDEKKGFDAYKKLVHPDRRSSAIAFSGPLGTQLLFISEPARRELPY